MPIFNFFGQYWFGTNQQDQYVGTDYGNLAHGMNGNDRLWMGGGNDKAYGGEGNDMLNGGAGDDLLVAGAGNDYAYGGTGVDVIHGGLGNDTMVGGDGDDFLNGGEGNDMLFGDAGNDEIVGGQGMDTVNYAMSSSGVGVNLAIGKGFGGDAEGDTYDSIEGVIGSNHDDILFGSASHDRLDGAGGNDILAGGAGSDHIRGGANGDGPFGDLLSGGQHGDIFMFALGDSGAGSGMDIVTDFVKGEDWIMIEGDFATVTGQQGGFVTNGAELYFQQTFVQGVGEATTVHYRDEAGASSDLDILLMGHQDLDASDFFFV
ncbi:MAG: calcium-binding protein [Pseudomonadota bacterium]